ncbi:rhamnosidase [Streptomyces armeniacus]|uniref:alpha-L-rhamnosidase n=1 Tax=Streptomyces armeniacus TaxID=83291 RepID=A0A345XK95_9ACTN|nr:alpha-L-rhamnosidase [Streptomyces armeniacus]AXK32061.1 rhamnosidase [Streptomyces armeniacus]
MISRRRLIATAAASGTAGTALGTLATDAQAAPAPPAGAAAGLRVRSTTTEYADRPLGVDSPRPRLSWVLAADGEGVLQHAYQIRVATSPDRLGSPDVWDSGKQTARQSVLVPYDGPALRPRTRYHWSVRVWGADGGPSPWSGPSWWETGLMDEQEWHADWISAPAALVAPPDVAGAPWVWHPDDQVGQVPAATRHFRGTFEVSGEVRRARLVLAVDDGFTAYVNGTEIAARDAHPVHKSWSHPALLDVTGLLREGANVLAVEAVNSEQGPAGLLAVLEAETAGGTVRFDTAGTWRTTNEPPGDGWQDPDHDDSGWQEARRVGTWGDDPWGKVLPEQSPAQLRRSFRLPGKRVARARLYVTALGLYEAHLNGARVGEDQLAPGWTDYAKRVAYQVHDVTDAVRRGGNALAVTLAPGWYAGNIGWFGQHHYGEHPALLARLDVVYADGSSESVGTDEQWRAATGPLLTADLMMGEQYDARRETPGWTGPGFDDSGWQRATAASGIETSVVAMTDAPTRITKEIEPVEVTEPKPGVFLYDLGQNMVGGVRLTVSGEAGRTVQLRHGEVLDKDGSLYVANLRAARPVDTYTLKGSGTETYQPRFTFHGFRYVEVTGYPGTPARNAVKGLVMHTAAPFTMDFATDAPMLNQLHRNITWGQRGNFLSVPTDTPARDERLGWSGDINVFAPTAAYNMESARFLTKWLQDLRDGQDDAGAYPDVAPYIGPVGKGVAGWGDAGVTVPLALHQAYGDRRVLEENWPAVRKWITYLEEHSDGLLRPAEGYGDWLNTEDETPKDVVGTAYFGHATDLAARTAKALGEDPGPYEKLFGRIRDAFNTAYVTEGGARVKGDTQTAYVLALSMDLLPDAAARRAAAGRLTELIESRDGHLSTGFLGTPRLLPALTAAGRTDVAYGLLEQRTFPSWGYQIDNGATTMWERWDSIKPDGSFQDVGMNSFNHYAYGCVGEWMYQNIAGIAPGSPGFREITVRPRPGGGVRSASGRYASPYGPVATRWTWDGADRFELTVTVPVNATAEVWVPAARAEDVARGDGAEFVRTAEGCAVFAVGSGRHRFGTGG